MTHPPLVYVCIPTFNSEKTLAVTLESITQQTYKNVKILIVDNASTDGTVVIAESFSRQFPQIEIHRFSDHVSGGNNCNRCMNLSSGDYTAIFHSDDVYEPDILEKEVAFLEQHPEVATVFATAHFINESGKRVGHHQIPSSVCPKGESRLIPFSTLLPSVLRFGNFLICPTALTRSSVYKQTVGGWNESTYATSADLDLWFRISQTHGIAIINEFLMNYRLSNNSFSFRYARTRTARHDLFLVLDDYVSRYSHSLLTTGDMHNYQQLLWRDHVERTISLLILGERTKARSLFLQSISLSAFLHSFSTIRRIQVTVAGIACLFLSFIPLPEWGRQWLFRLRWG